MARTCKLFELSRFNTFEVKYDSYTGEYIIVHDGVVVITKDVELKELFRQLNIYFCTHNG